MRIESILTVLIAAVVSMTGPHRASAATDGRSPAMPNLALVDQDGKQVRLYDDLIKDRIVLINFIFTSCTDYCPMETARVRRVQDLIGDRLGKDIFFYSISIDPKTDTPEVLKKYRERFGARAGWTFLTGNEAEISALRERIGLLFPDVDTKKTNHSLNMLIGNEKTGQWMRRSSMDKAELTAQLLTENLSEWRHVAGVVRPFETLPTAVHEMSRGEELYKTRCIDCHSIGGGDGLGPDLHGIFEARQLSWIKQWIKDPKKLIDARDPIALDLVQRFNQIVMPNLGLSDDDINDVIDYLSAESRKLSVQSKAIDTSKIEKRR